MAVKVWREPSYEEQLRELAGAVLDDPLHGDRAKDATLCADSDRGEHGVIAKHRQERTERCLEELENVVGCVSVS